GPALCRSLSYAPDRSHSECCTLSLHDALPILTQTSNFSSLGGSIASLVQWSDLLYALDIFILITLFEWSSKHWSIERIPLKKPLFVLATEAIVFAVNLGLAETDRPQLLKRTFDRNYIVKYLGAYNFAI